MSVAVLYLNKCMALPQKMNWGSKLCPTFCFEEAFRHQIKIIICQEDTYLGMFSPW
jgi:hypothetical protein